MGRRRIMLLHSVSLAAAIGSIMREQEVDVLATNTIEALPDFDLREFQTLKRERQAPRPRDLYNQKRKGRP